MTSTVYAACIFLWTTALSDASIQATATNFTRGKAVASSHTVLQPLSKVQCARKCYDEGKEGRCNIAGYNKTTKACYLSVDTHHDVIDVQDENTGVIFHPGTYFTFILH